ARIQLFDFKTTYSFQTIPGIDKYNMPVYSLQTEPGSQSISYYPVYQGFASPCYVNGIQIPFYGQRDAFYNIWPNFIQWNDQVATGDGGSTYQLTLPWFPAVPGHVDMTGIIKSGAADRKSTRLNSSHVKISYAVFCLKKKSSSVSDSTTY